SGIRSNQNGVLFSNDRAQSWDVEGQAVNAPTFTLVKAGKRRENLVNCDPSVRATNKRNLHLQGTAARNSVVKVYFGNARQPQGGDVNHEIRVDGLGKWPKKPAGSNHRPKVDITIPDRFGSGDNGTLTIKVTRNNNTSTFRNVFSFKFGPSSYN